MTADPQWLGDFPQLAGIRDGIWADTLQAASSFAVPAGRSVFRPGELCQSFVFVTRGLIRVQKTVDAGREVLLYRVERGDICTLTLFSLLGNSVYSAEGVAETEVEGILISAAQFHRCLAECERFRQFIFSNLAQRLSSLMMLVEEVMFQRLDVRLARLLLDRSHGGASSIICARHSELAVELGSSREVVSRILKEFEHRGWLNLGRGRILIEDEACLTGFASAKSGSLV